MDKKKLRHDQGEEIAVMMHEELQMANDLHVEVFVSPMEGLGVLQEEIYEATKDWKTMMAKYDSLQFYLCEGQTKAACDVAKVMKCQINDLIKELIQVGAMCQKFRDSEVLW